MTKLRNVIAICLSTATAFPAMAQTQPAPPSAKPITTISGTVGKMSDNRFMLETDSGAMLVTSGPSWHHRLDLKAGERVSVTGEGGVLDFDAFRITRADGQTIEIRPVEGPPPWVRVGGRGRDAGPPPWAGRQEGRDRQDGDRRGPPPWARPQFR
jgi:hypothetical protein